MPSTTNKDIREAISKAKLCYWRVAMELGISDGSFSRKLRSELPQTEKIKILQAIDKLAKEGE